MIPTPIPDAEVWEGAVRKVIGPPSGDPTDPTCRPVEALIDTCQMGPRFSMRCELEPGDLATLAAGGAVWVSIVGDHLHPFVVDVLPTATRTASLVVTVDLMAEQATPWEAQIDGIPDGMDPKVFVRGCIQALQEMLQKPLHEG